MRTGVWLYPDGSVAELVEAVVTADRLDLERLRGWAAPMAGVAVLLLLPWPLAPAAALAIVVALGVALPQLERQSDQVARRHRARDLPLCLDLLAACWSAGVVARG